MVANSGKNLVVVRAGRSSLHRAWVPASKTGSFDTIVSYYDKPAHDADDSGVAKVFHEGGKWDGLYKTLIDVPLDTYDFIWLPDDDIAASTNDVEAIFNAARHYNLSVCQPALSDDSYYSHFLVLACDSFRIRYTNYVEIMAPCLRADTLKKMLPLFSGTMSGFGFDHVWCRLQQENDKTAAILDEIAVKHTRPVGQHLKSQILKSGKTAEQEEDVVKAAFGIRGRIRPIAYAGVTRENLAIDGIRKMGLRMAANHLKSLGRAIDKRAACKGLIKMFRRQMTLGADLAPLKRGDASPLRDIDDLPKLPMVK
jgi:hypothetical protein